MTPPRRILVSWSSGKDSAWMLWRLRQEAGTEIVGLATAFRGAKGRVAVHDVSRELVDAQARAAGLPLWEILLPDPCPNPVYEMKMRQTLERARAAGVTQMAFGDLFLEDIRAYRVKLLAGSGVEPLFPLWGTPADTPALAQEMMAGGLKALITCVDTRHLPAAFAGRAWEKKLLDELPPGTDPCGERGEFHTFCHAGPIFAHDIAVHPGTTILHDNFALTDLIRD